MSQTKLQKRCMNHLNIWLEAILGFTHILRARNFWKDDLSHKMREMRVPWWRFLTNVILLGKFSQSPSWLRLALRKKERRECRGMVERGKREENEKGEWRHYGCVWWIGNGEGRKGKVVDGFVEGGEKMGESKREIHKIWERMIYENKQTSKFSHFIHKR